MDNAVNSGCRPPSRWGWFAFFVFLTLISTLPTPALKAAAAEKTITEGSVMPEGIKSKVTVDEYLEALAQKRIVRVRVADLPAGGARWQWEEKVRKANGEEEIVAKELSYISNETRERWLSILEERIRLGQKISISRYREEPPPPPWWLQFLPFIVVAVVIVILFFLISRSQWGPVAKFQKAVAKMHRVQPILKAARRMAQSPRKPVRALGRFISGFFGQEIPRVTFEDVGGVSDIKIEFVEIIDFLKNPKKYRALGAKLPAVIMLVGPPGTGKTLLAKAVAGEAGVPFFEADASRFEEMFVGVGTSRVEDLYKRARKNAPSIVFIDEIDAAGSTRTVKATALGGGPDAIHQLLIEWSGFDPNSGVITIVATNRPDVLDPALLDRVGRRIVISLPDQKGRKEILAIHFKDKPLAKDVDLKKLARRTTGMSGRALATLANESALLAARYNKEQISWAEVTEAIQRVVVGLASVRGSILSQEERVLASYHEGAHALIKKLDPNNIAKPNRATIFSTGEFLGYVMSAEEEERKLHRKGHYIAQIKAALAGRAGEEAALRRVAIALYGNPDDIEDIDQRRKKEAELNKKIEKGFTDGGASDFKYSTWLARRMTMRLGMSREFGPEYLSAQRQQNSYLGREDDLPHEGFGEETRLKIDAAIHSIVLNSYAKVLRNLSRNIGLLDRLAYALYERETLEEEEIEQAIDGELFADSLVQHWINTVVNPILAKILSS